MNLFVVVSTGQKVANLPPVLEHATKGDHILWVESDQARAANWTTPPRAVLERFGLVTVGVQSVRQLNDPSALASGLSDFAAAARGQYEAVYLVANGGQKLSPLGLLAAFRESSPQLLYGDDQPAVWNLYPVGLAGSPVIAPYTKHELDLSDLLRVNGRTFATHSTHVRAWPDPPPSAWGDERYGIDEAYTAELHAAHFARAQLAPIGERVPFDRLQQLVQARLTKWQQEVSRASSRPHPQALVSLYNATLNLDEAARKAVAKATAPAPAAALGPAFETAVARRVRAWAEEARHPAVRSVWVGVKVASEKTPHDVDQELDVLLVLTNGVLFHLECKSAELDARDMDARTHRLRQAGSQLARQVCVLPVYTAHAGTPWFAALHGQLSAAKENRIEVVGFTLPGQPREFVVPGSDPVEVAECPPFEQALDRLLGGYAARVSGSASSG